MSLEGDEVVGRSKMSYSMARERTSLSSSDATKSDVLVAKKRKQVDTVLSLGSG